MPKVKVAADLLNLRDHMDPDEWEIRMAQARRRAEWDLGSEGWASVIIYAFCNPADDADILKREMGDD